MAWSSVRPSPIMATMQASIIVADAAILLLVSIAGTVAWVALRGVLGEALRRSRDPVANGRGAGEDVVTDTVSRRIFSRLARRVDREASKSAAALREFDRRVSGLETLQANAQQQSANLRTEFRAYQAHLEASHLSLRSDVEGLQAEIRILSSQLIETNLGLSRVDASVKPKIEQVLREDLQANLETILDGATTGEGLGEASDEPAGTIMPATPHDSTRPEPG
jgi:hypothetical protein